MDSDLLDRIKKDYADEADVVIERLKTLDTGVYLTSLKQKIYWAIILLAEGSMTSFQKTCRQAEQDWRDLIGLALHFLPAEEKYKVDSGYKPPNKKTIKNSVTPLEKDDTSSVRSKNIEFVRVQVTEAIGFENINQYLKDYPYKQTSCPHYQNIVIYENIDQIFDEIGDMTDESYGYLSYLDFKTDSDKEIFIGSHPYNSAKLWSCKKCGYLSFSYRDGAWGRLTLLPVDFEKEYLIDPANKTVSIKPENINDFVAHFGFRELLSPERIKNYSGTKIISKHEVSLFSYRLVKGEEGEMINFQIIAKRDLLRRIFAYENQQ